MRTLVSGPALALSWLTVLPVRGPETVDRAAGRRAITAAPLVGVLLGGLAAGLLWLLVRTDLPPLAAGAITVAALALITRGMHIDGLGDTVDGLGCYGPPQRALAVMRGGGIGAFGATAIALTVLVQAATLPVLAERGMYGAIVVAVATGRVAVTVLCRRGTAPASQTGFGALVAGTQSPVAVAVWVGAALIAAGWAVPGNWWQGPVAATLALALTAGIGVHCARRFGGITGDVLGAGIEAATTITLIGLAI